MGDRDGAEKAVDESDYFARAQKRVWSRARLLSATYGIPRPIDVIEKALQAYEEILREMEERKRAPA